MGRKQAFIDDIMAACRKHGMALVHESREGGFDIVPYGADAVCLVAQASYHPSVSHAADAWIASQWLGRPVLQVHTQREGVVKKTLWDRAGALQCYVTDDVDLSFWCPAVDLVQK